MSATRPMRRTFAAGCWFAHLGATGRWFGQVGAVFTDPNSSVQGGSGVPPFMISRGGVPFTQWFAVGAYTAQGNSPNFFLNQQFGHGQKYLQLACVHGSSR